MGQYFKVVNLTKKEYFSADVFNEGIKQSNILRGIHGYALGKLLTIGLIEKNPKWQSGNNFGVWAGDRIVIVGDETPDELLKVMPLIKQAEIIPPVDLIEHEFDNINGKMICWLVNDEDFARWTLESLNNDESYIGVLGYVAYKYHDIAEDLICFLKSNFDKNWEKRFKQVCEDKANTFVKPNV